MGTNGVDSPASQPVAADGRMAELEALFLGGPLMAGNMHGAKSFSIETLLDILVVLFDECSNSSLRREKTVSEFIELGKIQSLILNPIVQLYISQLYGISPALPGLFCF